MDLTKPYKILINKNTLDVETPDIIDLKHGKVMTMEGHTFNIKDVKFVPVCTSNGPGVSFTMEWFK